MEGEACLGLGIVKGREHTGQHPAAALDLDGTENGVRRDFRVYAL
jgi:hypothetical protein